jgi:hypothetical protein
VASLMSTITRLICPLNVNGDSYWSDTREIVSHPMGDTRPRDDHKMELPPAAQRHAQSEGGATPVTRSSENRGVAPPHPRPQG